MASKSDSSSPRDVMAGVPETRARSKTMHTVHVCQGQVSSGLAGQRLWVCAWVCWW